MVLLVVGCNGSMKQDSQNEKAAPGSYQLVENWPRFQPGFELGMPTGLGIDTNGDIFVFHRAGREWNSPVIPDYPPISKDTILKLDEETGKILDSWGGGIFVMPHGLTIDNQNNVWVTDCGLHQVFKFDYAGQLLMTLGESRIPGDDTMHFNLPTDVAIASDGSFYVSDGYGNSRIMKFAPDGSFLLQWGSKGTEPGQFVIPHGIDLDDKGNVYVADRENNRIQIFDANGKFLREWQNEEGTDQLYAVTVDEARAHLFGTDYFTEDKGATIRGSDVFRFDLEANLQIQFGRTGDYRGPITRYHDIAVGRDGSIYLGDILGNRIQKFIPQ